MRTLQDRTIFITGASRGIGRAIALRAARDGANVVIAAKTVEPQPKLPGTIYSTAEEIEAAGGRALPCEVDVRRDEQVEAAVHRAVERFGGIDVLVNNASAISLTGTLQTPMKRYDLMFDINARGSFLCAQLCIPHLRRATNPHILNISPPLSLKAQWFRNHVAYSLAKYAMSFWVLGMSAEFGAEGIAVNALWPATLIGTVAVQNLMGGERLVRASRKPEIVADAAHAILTRSSRDCTGCFFVDEQVLREEGVTDFDRYAVTPGVQPLPDLFLDR
ncbi:MAG: NAD(P)-dependent oxidoreductase [Deltaproteobacteria bacterium]|nr:NAD(P)-dependent oxidoreductase [Deltaproteobacteria bacterium]